MTVKEFFKSKAFKCVAVLFCVLILSGALLTIAYGFLAVSDGEKLQRAISSIYSGETVTVYGANNEVIDDNDPESLVSETVEMGDAQILAAYKVEVGTEKRISYLISSKGLHGYGEGTVTCWVAVDADLNVEKVTISANTNQSFISKIGDSTLDYFTSHSSENGYSTSDDGFVTGGATRSSTAICNAVNGAVSYVNTVILGNSEENPFADFSYTDYVNTAKTEISMDGTDVKYSVVTKSYGYAGEFDIDITVGSDGAIKSYTVATNGSTHGYESKMPESVTDGSAFTSKDLSYFTGIYGESMAYTSITASLTTGASSGVASYSVYLCMYAGAFATANYQNAVNYLNGGANS